MRNIAKCVTGVKLILRQNKPKFSLNPNITNPRSTSDSLHHETREKELRLLVHLT